MQKFKAIVTFIFLNRRTIGTIVGLTLTLAGFPVGEEVVRLSSGG